MCGVIGIKDLAERDNVVPYARDLLKGVQHRGQLGAGLAWLSAHHREGMIQVLKGAGLVDAALPADTLLATRAESHTAIGHTRYATNPHVEECMVQPYVYPEFAFAFNGNIANDRELVDPLTHSGFPPEVPGDTEVLGRMILRGMTENGRHKIGRALQGLSALDGSFNVIMMHTNGDLTAVRDPQGFHPLVYAEVEGGRKIAIASETSAIEKIWHRAKIRDVKEGHMLRVSGKKGAKQVPLWMAEKKHCFFESVYFSDHESTVDGKPVATVRYRTGRALAALDSDRPSTDIVAPVPKSANHAARGYADERGIPFVEGIRKKLAVGRNFIEASDHDLKATLKYLISEKFFQDEDIIVIDDSLVRGSTIKGLVERLRTEGGARSVHLRLASPPVSSPCFYGINFPTVTELLSRRFSTGHLTPDGVLPQEVLDAMARELNVDSIKYLPVPEIPKALGQKQEHLCMACVTKEYPTRTGMELAMVEEKRAFEACQCQKVL